ncbi:putative GTPase MTG2 [Kluyveromyces lactis]|uniref:KLLA0A05225p n=1 Tax=Kluyveromyces lactis (strain ATCC 8585 / CBS 2359 / DSM 70799 / NBRC 1267 / NRRL Y-1140 / WM37) TaxID=284590 RepID=Q6CXV9_KLULA|nr:uncharacterized protein KLLA0_A05225g [Kluyveromyces lactis]CAH02818.1 KLLA0A05225p [Kluyveromyces lactis]|eukprot:XP_451230.1 uncharacterized protein KLLA0_A05225g [Kluyveromyces lactis]
MDTRRKSIRTGAIVMLGRPIFRRISRVNRCRFFSDVPDNAPGAIDNEIWLQELASSRSKQKAPTAAVESTQNLSIKEEKKTSVQPMKGLRNKITFNIISTPPDTQYIEIKSPLSNFTKLSYLQKNKNIRVQQSNFVDLRIIKCASGNGGDGCISFFRDRGRAIGPPDGGDGGGGGSVYVQAIEGINSLSKLQTTYIADNGSNGTSAQADGSKGKDVMITVPVGTVVTWCLDPKVVREHVDQKIKEQGGGSLRTILDTSNIILNCTGRFYMDQKPNRIQMFRESYEPGKGWIFKGKDEEYHLSKDWFQDLSKNVTEYDHNLLQTELESDRFPLYGLDLSKPTEKPICLLKGGKGGLGNMHFLTSLIRNPRFCKEGRSGLQQHFMFELKSIADLGLVGLPNAGKSTILNQISNATPRVGHWEFTTLHPTIGTISLGIDKPKFTVADIPGIIKDASQDKGMGLEFLRHIERSKGWVFVISLEKDDPSQDLQILIEEVGGKEVVSLKNILVVCNKADIDEKSTFKKYQKIQAQCQENNWDVVPISALKGENIDVLLHKMAQCAGKL